MAPEDTSEQLELFADTDDKDANFVDLPEGPVEAEPMTYGAFLAQIDRIPVETFPNDTAGHMIYLGDNKATWLPDDVFHAVYAPSEGVTIH